MTEYQYTNMRPENQPTQTTTAAGEEVYTIDLAGFDPGIYMFRGDHVISLDVLGHMIQVDFVYTDTVAMLAEKMAVAINNHGLPCTATSESSVFTIRLDGDWQ
jgi:hypothetical protein